MELKEFVHMTPGDGEFSFAVNATVPIRVFNYMIKPILEKVIKSQLSADFLRACKVLTVADLGCGVGQTPIALISALTETVHRVCKELKVDDDKVLGIQIYLNDLPSNDFNLLFKDVEKFLQESKRAGMPICYVMGAPGSFFDQLFPPQSLHFVHCNYALHWLSQVPPGVCDEKGIPINKDTLVASERSPPEAIRAYYGQFRQDFTSFLRSRSRELVPSGHQLFALIGRPSLEHSQSRFSKLLYEALARLVSKGVIKEERLDAFDIPVYYPCKEEIQDIVTEEGSFTVEHTQIGFEDAENHIKDVKLRAEALAKGKRAVTEALISYHFGAQIWDVLYDELRLAIQEHLESDKGPMDIYTIVVLLRRKMA